MSVSVMKRLTVIASLGDEAPLIKRLVKLKCVEVTSAHSDDYGYLLDGVNYDGKRLEIEKKIAVLERVIPALYKRTARGGGLFAKRLKINRDEFISDGSYDVAWGIASEADRALSRIAECRNEIMNSESEMLALVPWSAYGVALNYSGTQNTEIILGTFPAQTAISTIQEALGELLCGVEIVSQDEGAVYASIFAHRSQSDEVQRRLTELGFLRVSFKGVDTTPKKAIMALHEKKDALEAELKELEESLHGYAELIGDIELLWDIERTNLTIVESSQQMARTEKCVVLSGWVPGQYEERVGAALDDFGCAYDIRSALEGEEPPVHLSNNGFASNFEWVVGMYSYPKYGSFDPTMIMSIFYFFIFGLMFADVGYGLLLTLGGLLIPRLIDLSPGMKRSFYMFGYCGISSMIMGVLFGGWFGDLPYAIMKNFMGIANAEEVVPFFNGVLFNPVKDPMAFLIFSLGVGAVHLIAGMVVKFVILCREGKVLDAIFDIGSWFIIFAGVAVFALVGALAGGIVCGVGALMIIVMHGRGEKNIFMRFAKGLLGLYDITSYASDLLSYSRILALGLAAAVIAQVINLIGTMVGPSVGGFIALVLAFLIGHTLNLAINILGSFVHTSRLQYLEFFNKFYEDGGKQFEAIAPSEKYTVD